MSIDVLSRRIMIALWGLLIAVGTPRVSAEDEAPLSITQPTLIAFFPPATESEIAADASLASALDHFEYAYYLTEKCLAHTKVKVLLHRALKLAVKTDHGLAEFDLSEGSNQSLGCYLAAPGRAAKVVFATGGPSSLIVVCPAAAATYFDVPSCCPEGFNCCPDGTLKSEESKCDG